MRLGINAEQLCMPPPLRIGDKNIVSGTRQLYLNFNHTRSWPRERVEDEHRHTVPFSLRVLRVDVRRNFLQRVLNHAIPE